MGVTLHISHGPMSRLHLVASIALAAALQLAPATEASAQADTLRAGSPAIAALTLHPGIDSSDTYAIRNGERRLVATYIEETLRTPDGYLIVGRNVRPDGATLSLDSIVLAPRTLLPLRHADAVRGGRMTVRFADGRMRGTAVDASGGSTTIDSIVPPGLFDYSVAMRVVNLLPLRAGYTVVIPSYDIRRGLQHTRVTVMAEETIEVRGRPEPAWKVEADYGRFKATRWIHRESRKDLRTIVNANGMEMVVEYR